MDRLFKKKKKVKVTIEYNGEDRISTLTDDVIHQILNLQNLTLELRSTKDYSIPCPQLVNLEIKTQIHYDDRKGEIVVSAPKLSTFTSVGIFSITFGASKLDNVYLKLRGSIDYSDYSRKELKEIFQRFTYMLPALGSAKILNLELHTIKALSLIPDFLASSPPPFYNLKYVKLPHGYKEASLSSSLRSYLLGGSPTATIVTTSRENMIHQIAAASVTAVDNDSVVLVGAAVEGSCNDQVSSSRKNIDSGLWQGNEVNSESVCLLDQIMKKYPETFEHLDTKNKKFCTMKLNMLCTAVNDFIKIPVTEVDTEIIVEYRDVFADLQKLGFNLSWLVTRLNNIEQLWFPQPLLPKLHATDCQDYDAKSILQDIQIRIDDANIKLQDLQTLRAEKMQEIQKAFKTMDTNLVVGYVGDDLLSGL
ncbi:hypothetical protein POM88_007933 [Heracleum sosnowskyi]|uniref:Uncharacterized protein n=1 Tax=Heracleum sosnowskyi TaxID=360622 RepID=A0AAD8N1A2_9APIA|nr:hypothetical protein POM88_007933 [Heracleum sosnowskyi]